MYKSDEKGVIRLPILAGSEPDVKLSYISANGANTSYSTLSNHDSQLNNNIKLFTKAVKNIEQKVKLTCVIHPSELVDGRFLPSELLIKLIKKHGKKAILLRSGLGTGKSWSLAEVMQGQNRGRGVAACHRIGLTQQLSNKFNADNYRSVRDAGGEYSDRLGTTIHSLPRMLTTDRTANAFDSGLFVLDESNSCAAEITNATVKNEALTIKSVGEAYQKAELMVCADAHLDLSTVDLLEAAGVPLDEMMLIVVDYPELEGYTVNIWEDEPGDDGKPATKAAFMNQILADVRNNLKVIVTSLSATFLEELNREAEKQGIADGIGGKRLVTSDTPMIDREALTAESYQGDVLTMLSPAMSTGISFNKTRISETGSVINCPDYKHADRCYVVLSNGMDTGGYQDGLQAMMRERAVKDSTINCYYAESPVPLPSASRIAKVAQNESKANKAAFDELAKHVAPGINPAEIWGRNRPNHNKADAFLLSQALRTGEQKRDFLELFVEECQVKGATVNEHCPVSELADGKITFQVLKAEKQKEREEWKQARIDAMKLDSDDVDGLDDAIAKPALDRLYIEEQAVIDFDQLELSERGEWIERFYPESGKGIQNIAREIERSQADTKLIAELVSAGMLGASGGEGDRVRFLEKSTTDKKHWFSRAKYTQLILKAAGVAEVNGELIAGAEIALNAKEVRKMKSPCYGLYHSLKQNPEPAIMCGYISVETKPADVKANPLPFMLDMLASIGIKTRKARGKPEWKIQGDSLDSVLGMVNRRKAGGINELKDYFDKITEYIDSYHARKSAQTERDSGNKDRTPDNVLAAMNGALDRVNRPELLDAAIEYFEPFHDRIKAKKLSATVLHLMVKRWLDNTPG
ncbi:MAG: Unknown protein [uncultured Thiotrichaceae bacterium]|uniref:Uncharacterized protein n=1 Tax=uncultured Thiotrichaceae bacterium TaxID=298394 RepID=A0A6S6TK96_9GAMM|nr:MAG: Unknown protein [uncultured Thiotrichaceae bacterium]